VIRKLFGYHKWESVSAVLLGLGRLNFKHLLMLRKVKFYWHLYRSTDVFLRDMGLGTKKVYEYFVPVSGMCTRCWKCCGRAKFWTGALAPS